jgi:hypothetical protein
MAMPLDLSFTDYAAPIKSVVPSAAGTAISPSIMAEVAMIRNASSVIFLTRLVPILAAAGEHRHGFMG